MNRVASFFLFVVLLWLVGCNQAPKESPLPRLGKAPNFTLTDTQGVPFSFGAAGGKVRVVSFFFSRCPSICPRINEQLAAIQSDFSEDSDLLFVSISVDPEFDSSSVLAEYSQKYRKSPDRWKFLTGEKALIEDLLDSGFKLSSGMLPDEHNTRVVIVDRGGEIRGFYQGMDKDHMSRLKQDLATFFR